MKTGPRSQTWLREGGSRIASLRYVAVDPLSPAGFSNKAHSETIAKSSREDWKTWNVVLALPLLLQNNLIPNWPSPQPKIHPTNNLSLWLVPILEGALHTSSRGPRQKSCPWTTLPHYSTLLPHGIFPSILLPPSHFPHTHLPRPIYSTSSSSSNRCTTAAPVTTRVTLTPWKAPHLAYRRRYRPCFPQRTGNKTISLGTMTS
jgi:hypothetical protein